MIRFIDLSNQIEEGINQFSFFDTVTDKFEEFSGSQTWETVYEFQEDYDGNNIDRYLDLIPLKWILKR